MENFGPAFYLSFSSLAVAEPHKFLLSTIISVVNFIPLNVRNWHDLYCKIVVLDYVIMLMLIVA